MSWHSLSNQVDRHITTLKTLRAKLESRLVGMVVARALRLPDVTIYSLPPPPPSLSYCLVCRHDLKARSDEYRHWQKDFLPKKQAVMIGRYLSLSLLLCCACLCYRQWLSE